MTSPRWTSDLATGNPDIDRDHQELVEIIDQLKAAASGGDQKARLSNSLDRFRSHVLDHFPSEEREMEAKAYPGLAKHRVAHAALADQVLELVQKDNAGETVLFSEVEHLAQALYRHILLDDKPFALYLVKG
ncbi:MAG: hemerythrin family protein [Planctomycetes bacterium]|nr:hemerythrin family protein [Planctomycetota bacterium]